MSPRNRRGGNRHLLDIRIQAVCGRIQTRCGRFKPGQDESTLKRPNQVQYIKDWDNLVDLLPKEGEPYCRSCKIGFNSSNGYEEYEEYKEKIVGV